MLLRTGDRMAKEKGIKKKQQPKIRKANRWKQKLQDRNIKFNTKAWYKYGKQSQFSFKEQSWASRLMSPNFAEVNPSTVIQWWEQNSSEWVFNQIVAPKMLKEKNS